MKNTMTICGTIIGTLPVRQHQEDGRTIPSQEYILDFQTSIPGVSQRMVFHARGEEDIRAFHLHEGDKIELHYTVLPDADRADYGHLRARRVVHIG